MKLKGHEISGINTLRKYWEIDSIWNSVNNGNYLRFLREKDIGKSDSREGLLHAIEPGGMDSTPCFYSNNAFDKTKLTSALQNFHCGQLFITMNERQIDRLVCALPIGASSEASYKLFVFLLLYLHAFPEKAIPDGDIQYFKKKMSAINPNA